MFVQQALMMRGVVAHGHESLLFFCSHGERVMVRTVRLPASSVASITTGPVPAVMLPVNPPDETSMDAPSIRIVVMVGSSSVPLSSNNPEDAYHCTLRDLRSDASKSVPKGLPHGGNEVARGLADLAPVN